MNRREAPPGIFWTLAAIGFGVMGYGLYGLVAESARTQPAQWIRWFLGSAIAHDFVVAPFVVVIGVAVTRYVPAWVRGPLQGALVASGVLVITAYPFLRGYGRNPANPSVLPNNYAHGLLVALVLVWISLALVLVMRRRALARSARKGLRGDT